MCSMPGTDKALGIQTGWEPEAMSWSSPSACRASAASRIQSGSTAEMSWQRKDAIDISVPMSVVCEINDCRNEDTSLAYRHPK
eukprot:100080-Lingulodinium_polyedra.AAC.1